MSTRPAEGIRASGGRLRHGPACSQTGSVAASDTVRLAWIGPVLARLEAARLETLVLDEPSLIVDAYNNEANRQSGIPGNCFELVKYK